MTIYTIPVDWVWVSEDKQEALIPLKRNKDGELTDVSGKPLKQHDAERAYDRAMGVIK